jgi:hypothetical protein
VYPKFVSSFALIPSLILEDREDEGLLKFADRFRALQTGSVHLQDDTLELFLHRTFPLTESLHARWIAFTITQPGRDCGEEDLAGKGKGRDIGYALAAGSLRGSQRRGSMHHHGP